MKTISAWLEVITVLIAVAVLTTVGTLATMHIQALSIRNRANYSVAQLLHYFQEACELEGRLEVRQEALSLVMAAPSSSDLRRLWKMAIADERELLEAAHRGVERASGRRSATIADAERIETRMRLLARISKYLLGALLLSLVTRGLVAPGVQKEPRHLGATPRVPNCSIRPFTRHLSKWFLQPFCAELERESDEIEHRVASHLTDAMTERRAWFLAQVLGIQAVVRCMFANLKRAAVFIAIQSALLVPLLKHLVS